MTKYLLYLLPLLGLASQISMEHAQMRPLGQIVQANAQITQLSEQKQEIVSRLSGHVEKYFIKAGGEVKTDDKVALIESIELSKMTAEYLSLYQQTKAAKEQLTTAKTLHAKGLSSQNDISKAIIILEEIRAKQNALTSQLKSLGIKPESLTQATDQFILYTHSDGIVGKILAPLHSNVNAQTPLMTLVNQSGYYAVAYMSVNDAMKVNITTKGSLRILDTYYPCHFVQRLPRIDEETQRAQVLFQIENAPKNLLLGAYTEMEIALAPTKEVLMIKKSALTLFQGEWVVFVEAHHEEGEEEHNTHKEDEHAGHDHKAHKEKKYDALELDDHNEHEEEKHNDHDEHKGHGGHDDHEEEKESPYTPKVVNIIAYSGEYVAIEGLEVGVEYVSEGVYFVKSMLLKSSLGGHGH